MAIEDQNLQFKVNFATILKELMETGGKDPEMVGLIGSLAGSLVVKAKKESWTDLKASLTREAYDGMLKQFEEQGNSLHQQGKTKAAYAAQAVAVSVIASKMPDPSLKNADKLMDKFITSAIRAFHLSNKNNMTLN